MSRDGRRRSHIEGERKGAQHRRQPLLQVLHGANQEKIGIACLQRARQAPADKGTVEKCAHQAPDMAWIGQWAKGFSKGFSKGFRKSAAEAWAGPVKSLLEPFPFRLHRN